LIKDTEGHRVEIYSYIDTTLRKEGDCNEICHEINNMRKKDNLKVEDKIILFFDTKDNDLIDTLLGFKLKILTETNAKALHIIPLNRDIKYQHFSFESYKEGWAIHEKYKRELLIGIEVI